MINLDLPGTPVEQDDSLMCRQIRPRSSGDHGNDAKETKSTADQEASTWLAKDNSQ